jgi:hypothetical protein
LTTSFQLRTAHPHLDLVGRKRRAPRAGSALGTRRSQPRVDPAIRPLTPLSRPSSARSFMAERSRDVRTASTALASTRAASLIRGAFHQQVLPYPLSRREPATLPTALPPRAGFRRSFAPDVLSHGGARPSSVVTGYSPVVVRTTRRLSTSAIETITRAQPHDRSNLSCHAGVSSCTAR